MSTAAGCHGPLAYRVSPHCPGRIPPSPASTAALGSVPGRPRCSRRGFGPPDAHPPRWDRALFSTGLPHSPFQFCFFAHLDSCSSPNVSSPLAQFPNASNLAKWLQFRSFSCSTRNPLLLPGGFLSLVESRGIRSIYPVEIAWFRPQEPADPLLNPAPDHRTSDKLLYFLEPHFPLCKMRALLDKCRGL